MTSLQVAQEFLETIYSVHLAEAVPEQELMDFSDMFKKERPRGPPKKALHRKRRSPILKLGEEENEEEESKDDRDSQRKTSAESPVED